MAEYAMRDLDLTSLRLWVAVCDHQNIARAAEREHIAASAISKRIAQLEDQLGTPLMVRGRRGVQPTPAGEALLEHARSIMFTLERIENDVSVYGAGLRGQVSLLATPSAIAEALLDDVAAFMQVPENRNIRIDIEERLTRDLVRALREGSASVGVCWDSVDLKGLQARHYREDELALAVHPDHPLAGKSSLRFEQVLDYELVGMPPASSVQIMLQRAAARIGRSIGYRVIVSNFDSAFRVVAANLAVGILPREVGLQHAATRNIRMIPLTDSWAKRRFVVCFRDYDSLQPAAKRMIDYLAG
jgi:DNA-binding transcriptional LysR family regulator